MSFNSTIDGSGEFWPGIYNGDVTSPDYNPLGWYTYKIVVKQTEQEYYNVYTAGVMQDNPYDYSTSAPPTAALPINANTSFVTLINDNINKVPRDLTEVGPQDKTFRSSVVLFGRVVNNAANYSNTGNEQFYPQRQSFTTNAIEDLFDLFDVLQFTQGTTVVPITDSTSPFSAFYKADSNPFVGEFVTSQDANFQFGVFNTKSGQNFNKIENLAILETAPTVSRLDIYWETSTAGIISDLNNAVSNSPGSATANFDSFNTTPFEEDIVAGDEILASNFEIVDNFGVEYDPSVYDITVSLDSVIDGAGNPVTNFFDLTIPVNTPFNKEFNVEVNSNFINNSGYGYYGADANVRNFSFTFLVTLDDTTVPNFVPTTTTIVKSAALGNIGVSLFEVDGTTPLPATENLGIQAIPTTPYGVVKEMKSKNGANSSNSGRELTWTIVSVFAGTFNVTTQNYFRLYVNSTASISSCDLEVINTVPVASSSGYDITIECSDAGGAVETYECNVKYGTVPTSVQNVQMEYEEQGGYGLDIANVIVIYITDQPAANGTNGWYVYDGTWNDLQNSAVNNVITIDYLNASTTTACGTNPRDWHYSSVSQLQATETVWDDCAAGGQGYDQGSASNVNTSGYSFAINF